MFLPHFINRHEEFSTVNTCSFGGKTFVIAKQRKMLSSFVTKMGLFRHSCSSAGESDVLPSTRRSSQKLRGITNTGGVGAVHVARWVTERRKGEGNEYSDGGDNCPPLPLEHAWPPGWRAL